MPYHQPYDQNNGAGMVNQQKTSGVLDVQQHGGAISIFPAVYRPFIGSPESGFHSAPQNGDTCVILYGPNNQPLTVVPMLASDNINKRVMPALNPGESGVFHKSGKFASKLTNAAGGTIYSDPTNSVSFIASAVGFVLTGILSLLNLIITGTLNVTGLSTLTGGASLGGNLAMGGHNITGASSISGSVLSVSGGVVGASFSPSSGSTFPIGGTAIQFNNSGISGGTAGAVPTQPIAWFPINVSGIAGHVPIY